MIKMSVELWWIILSGRPEIFGEACPSVAFSTKNLTQIDLRLIASLSYKRLATNRLSHGKDKPLKTVIKVPFCPTSSDIRKSSVLFDASQA